MQASYPKAVVHRILSEAQIGQLSPRHHPMLGLSEPRNPGIHIAKPR